MSKPNNIIFLDNSSFDQLGNLTFNTGKPLLVVVLAEWCGYCKKAKPIIQEFADKSTIADVGVILEADHPELMARLKSIIPEFRGFPHFVWYTKDGKPVKEAVTDRSVDGLQALASKLGRQ